MLIAVILFVYFSLIGLTVSSRLIVWLNVSEFIAAIIMIIVCLIIPIGIAKSYLRSGENGDDKTRGLYNRFILISIVLNFIMISASENIDELNWLSHDPMGLAYMCAMSTVILIAVVFASKIVKLVLKSEINLDDGSKGSWLKDKILAPIIVGLVLGSVSYYLTGDFSTSTKVTVISAPINILLGSKI